MSYLARGHTQSVGIDGKASAASRRRCGWCLDSNGSEATV